MPAPVWFLDVDGVVASWNTPARKHGAYETTTIDALPDVAPVVYSRAVIDRINDIHRRGLATVRWLTTWSHDARTLLAPAVGLDDFDVVPPPAPGTTTWTDNPRPSAVWWKVGRVLEFIAAHPDHPYLWTDDLLFKADKLALRAASDAPALLMTVMRTPGLTPANLDRIEEFCRDLAGS